MDPHHDVMSLPVIICILVSYSLLRVAILSRQENNNFVKIVHGKVIEIVWTITPSLILAIIAVPSLASPYSMDEVIDPASTSKAIGHQRYWSHEYSDYDRLVGFDSYMIPADDLSEGDLRLLEVDNPIYLPVGAHVRLLITSDDVLHRRTIPSSGVKVDARPGRLNQTSIFINREGRYYGQCSEIRGINHGFTPIRAKAVPLDTHVAWVSSQFDEKTRAAILSLGTFHENMQTLLLDLFASIALTCAMGVIVSTNSIHSVISSTPVFRNATGLLLTLTPKAEFIAITFLIIYVGAIAVPFPLVVMTPNVRQADTNWLRQFTAAGAIILRFLVVPCASVPAVAADMFALAALLPAQALGNLIYTYYLYFLILAGLILLVAMIGAIVLTIHKRKNASKKQFIFEQVARRFEDAIYWAS